MEPTTTDKSQTEKSESKGLPEGCYFPLLGEVIKPTRPRVKPAEYPNLPFIGMEHIEAHTMRLLGTAPASTMKSSSVHFYPGDVLYGRLRPYLNKVYRAEFEGLCSAEFIVFPKSESVDERYLQYFLNSWEFVSYASHLNEGDRPRVDFQQLAQYPFPLAPLPVQHLIVAEIEKQFSRLDEAVAGLKRVQANLKRYKASVLKAAVEGRLTEEWRKQNICRGGSRTAPTGYESGADLIKRILVERSKKWEEDYVKKYVGAHGHAPKDDSWKKKYKEPTNIDEGILTDIPVKWKWASAEAVCSSVRDGTHDTPKYLNEGIPLVTSKNLLPSGLDFGNINYISNEDHMEISKRSAVEEGDVLFAMIGTVGNPVVVKTHRPFSIKNVGLFKKNTVYLLSEYLKIWLTSPVFGAWLKPRLKGTTQKFAPLGLLRSLAVPLPPIAEQRVIIAEVDRRLSVAEEIEAVIETNLKRAERMRQAILKKAFEGRLV